MNQEEFANALKPWKQQLMDEIIIHYMQGRAELGNQIFERWKERFTSFLQTYTPNEAKRFKQKTKHYGFSSKGYNNPYAQFMEEDGDICVAFIDELTEAAHEEYISDFQENPSIPPVKDKPTNHSDSSSPYVNVTRLQELRDITSSSFDLTKLVRLCEELNLNFANKCYFSVSVLLRAVVDHVPPIFGHTTFKEVANNYSTGSRSFKESMQHLDISSRKIADSTLHGQVRAKETLSNETQVNFSPDLDVLLSEVVRKLK